MEGERIIEPTRSTVLKNQHCPYCGDSLAVKPANVEHVIGRRFVPKGSLDNVWNLKLNACQDCNDAKGQLEGDISAITMITHSGGDDVIEEELKRKTGGPKGGAISQRTGKPVSQSQESITLSGPLRPATDMDGPSVWVTVTLTGPPQVDEPRTMELAKMHIKAFNAFITARGGKRLDLGTDPQPTFMFVNVSAEPDWGNALQTSFRDQVLDKLSQRLHVITANGYFKCVIHESTSEPLSAWALEWNKSYRVIGYLGSLQAVRRAAAELEPPMPSGDEVRIRRDIKLAAAEDTLFVDNLGDVPRVKSRS